jgi:hypothetical protein
MTKWEYRLNALELRNLEEDVEQVNKLGDEGWELVALLSRNAKLTDLLAVYKRPKS